MRGRTEPSRRGWRRRGQPGPPLGPVELGPVGSTSSCRRRGGMTPRLTSRYGGPVPAAADEVERERARPGPDQEIGEQRMQWVPEPDAVEDVLGAARRSASTDGLLDRSDEARSRASTASSRSTTMRGSMRLPSNRRLAPGSPYPSPDRPLPHSSSGSDDLLPPWVGCVPPFILYTIKTCSFGYWWWGWAMAIRRWPAGGSSGRAARRRPTR